MAATTLVQDSKKRLIVQHNDLITARYDLDVDAFRVLMLILSKVNQREENPGWVTITAHEYQKTFGVSRKNTARCFKNAVTSLWNGSIEFYVVSAKKQSLIVMRWITTHKFEQESGQAIKLMVKLNPDLDNFLFNIKNNFSSFFLKAIQSVKTVSAFRLYMILASNKSHPKCKRKGFFEVDISIDELREIFPDASNRTSDFIRRTIEPSVLDINRNSNFSVTFQAVRRGRNVQFLRFGCVEETASISKPVRPRLAKRPHVTAGSHAEGEWMKTNAEILYQYEKSLKEYDPELKLDMPDLRRAIACSKLFKPDWHREKLAELQERQRKASPKMTA